MLFSGSNDGGLRAYATRDGSLLWEFDTNQDFTTLNRVRATGGSGPVTSFGTRQRKRRKIRWTGAYAVTNGSNLIIPGGSATTKNGDVWTVESDTSSPPVWRVTSTIVANQTLAEGGTDDTVAMSPLRVSQAIIRNGQQFRNIVGRNNVDESDPTGKVVGREILRVAADPGFGWVDYHFRHPTTGEIVPKSVYVEAVEGIILGCGIYGRAPAPAAAASAPVAGRLGGGTFGPARMHEEGLRKAASRVPLALTRAAPP